MTNHSLGNYVIQMSFQGARLVVGKRVLEEEHEVMVDANAAHVTYRREVIKDGRRLGQ